MPAFVTHHLFADQVFHALPEGQAKTAVRRNYDAFLWGAQGPDILFFNKISTVLPLWGSVMHHKKVKENFAAMQRYLIRTRQGFFFEAQLAYALGFLCHYALDKTCHPYVYCVQAAFQEDPRVSSGAHNRIESDIDTALYRRLTGRSVREYAIPQSMFAPHVTKAIALYLSYLLRAVYGAKTSVEKVEQSFLCDDFFISLFVGKAAFSHRVGLGLDKLTGRRYAFSGYMRQERADWDCLNLRHRRWCNLQRQVEKSRESVPELMERARDEAVEMIAAFCQNVERMRPRAICGDETFDNGHPERKTLRQAIEERELAR